MFKYCFSIIFSLMLVSTSFASDKIYLNNGLIIDGTITQINIESVTIQYGEHDLTRTLHKGAIKVIIYEDGTAVTFDNVVIQSVNSDSLNVKLLEARMIKAEVKTARIYGFIGGIGCCVGIYIITLLALVI